jgi:excisionase family DNA binding protein
MNESRFPELMTPAQVAAALKVDPKTVARYADDGTLRSIRTPGRGRGPGHRRFFAEDIDKILRGES